MKPGNHPPKAGDPKDHAPARTSGGGRRTGRAPVKTPTQDVLLWGQPLESPSRRPDVVPADPTVCDRCLCGEPADFVVKTRWFSGRRSHDPVCRHHLDEVVRAINKELARRNGA
jgi:hypothetical protein